MRRLISVGLAAALLLAAAPVALGLLHGLSRGHGAAASSTLTCSVKTSCTGPGEVAVFRMSSLTNAHAETAAGTTYGNIVCCSGVTGLSASCALPHTTVLRLWAATNAHVARASETSYTTEACLSAPSTTITCQYGSSCDAGAGYVCLATMSGAGVTNAHVADCASAYSTKVCCAATAACTDRDGDTTCRDPVNDTDDDGCTAAQEAALGAEFSDNTWYDVYDVPVPANSDPTLNGPRNRLVDISDVLAVLFYAFADEGGGPNPNHVSYDSLKGIQAPHDTYLKVGLMYDRSPGPLPNPPWSAGPPNGVMDIGDVLAVLAQAFVVDCTGP
jgi:hypothetical protein